MVEEANNDVAVTIPTPTPSTTDQAPRLLILFDGVCNVCDTFVGWVYRRDKEKKFYFQALQSKKGREILSNWAIPHDLKTVVLIDEAAQTYYTKSTAIFNILSNLQKPWSYMYYMVYLPRFLRDFGYNTFANIRYSLFGKKDECAFNPGLKDRFIDWRSPIIETSEEGSKDM